MRRNANQTEAEQHGRSTKETNRRNNKARWMRSEIDGRGQNGHRAMETRGRPGPTGSPERRARPGQALLERPRATDAQTLQPNYVTRRRR